MMKYRPEIDGLRAIAVLPVILFHAGFDFFKGGFVGVDVFFVISGYLITTIIILEISEGRFSILNFYERRARRILPALFFMMTACIPFAWLWLKPDDLKDFGQSLIAVSTFSSNILFWLESGYFDTATELKPLLHTWSLAVEEQYYILFPIFLILSWNLGLKRILFLLLIVFLISLGIAQWGSYNSPSASFYLLPTRGWELLIGVFIAFYLKYNTYLKSLFLNQALSLLGFGMVTYSIITFDETVPFPSLYTLIPTLGTGLLILSAVPKTLIHKLLSLKLFVGTGLISYSAYLWHQPILAFTRHRLLGDVSEIVTITLCLASLAIAWLSWKLVEAPFRNKVTFDRKSIFRIFSLFLIIFCSSGLYFHMNSITPSKVELSDREISIPYKYRGIIDEGRKCSFPDLINGEGPCEIYGGGELGEVVIIGDSLARVLSESFYSSVDSFYSLTDLTAAGCPFILNSNIYIGKTQNCSSDYQLSRQKILKERPNSSVVYQARFPIYFYGNGFDNEQPSGKEVIESIRVTGSMPFSSVEKQQQHFLESLTKSIEFIAKNNKKLFMVLPSFSNGWNPVDRLLAMGKLGFSLSEARQSLSISREVVNERTKLLKAKLLSISERFDNIEIIDPDEYFCSEQSCSPLSEDGELLFTDEDHFSLTVNDLIFKEVKKLMDF